MLQRLLLISKKGNMEDCECFFFDLLSVDFLVSGQIVHSTGKACLTSFFLSTFQTTIDFATISLDLNAPLQLLIEVTKKYLGYRFYLSC